jgi:hypothetical protein
MQSFGQVINVLGAGVGFPGHWSRTADTIIVARPVLSTTATNLPFGAGAVIVPSATGGSWQSFADYLATPANAATLAQYFAGVATFNFKTMQPYSALAQTSSGITYTTTATQASVGATTIVVASATNLAVGQSVEGAGIAANTLVTAISGTTITISLGTLAALSSTTVAFTSSTVPAVGYYSAGASAEVLVRSSITVNVNGNGTPQAGNPVYVRTVANSSIGGTSVGDFEAAADSATTAITIGTTIGSTSVTTSAGTGLAIGQSVSSAYFPSNTTIVSGSGTSWVFSNAALATVASGGAMTTYNTLLLGSLTDPWLKFRTGVIDNNDVAEILISNRHAA